MSIADLLTAAAAGAGGGGVGVALVQALFGRGGLRAQAAKTETETEVLDRETWLKQAKDSYDRVDQECKDCKAQLRASDIRHGKEMAKLRREVGELRDALLKRVDVVDELLPYVQDMPDDKMREVRTANRAAKLALWNLAVPDG